MRLAMERLDLWGPLRERSRVIDRTEQDGLPCPPRCYRSPANRRFLEQLPAFDPGAIWRDGKQRRRDANHLLLGHR